MIDEKTLVYVIIIILAFHTTGSPFLVLGLWCFLMVISAAISAWREGRQEQRREAAKRRAEHPYEALSAGMMVTGLAAGAIGYVATLIYRDPWFFYAGGAVMAGTMLVGLIAEACRVWRAKREHRAARDLEREVRRMAAGVAAQLDAWHAQQEFRYPSTSLSPFLPLRGQLGPDQGPPITLCRIVRPMMPPPGRSEALSLLHCVRGVRFFEPTPGEPQSPLGRDDAHDVGQRPLSPPPPLAHIDEAEPARLPHGVLHRGLADARPGRDGIEVERAAAVIPALVADDAERRELALRELGGQRRRHRA